MFSKRQRVCEEQIGRMLCADLKVCVRFLVLGFGTHLPERGAFMAVTCTNPLSLVLYSYPRRYQSCTRACNFARERASNPRNPPGHGGPPILA